MSFKTLLVPSVASWLFLSTALLAQPFGYSVASDQLMRIDLSTGSFSQVPIVGTFSIGGLTMTPSGELLALSHFSDDLWRIDPTDGSTTLIGPLGVPVEPDSALTLDACGNLWMIIDQQIYSVDEATAATTFVNGLSEGVRGLTSDGPTLLGLAQTPSQLAIIEPSTGSVARFGDLAGIPTLEQGLDFDEDGRLWGVYWQNGPIPDPSVSVIVEFDPVSGAVLSNLPVPQAQVDPVFNGNLAITPPRGVCSPTPVAVPMSSSALTVLVLLIAAAGIVWVRRI